MLGAASQTATKTTARRFDGKVAFITGAARGQGRAHAVRLAAEGADIIAVDVASSIKSVAYELATADDLDETRRLVEAEGRNVIARRADVRDQASLDAAVAQGLEEFGRLDIVLANAGVFAHGAAWEMDETDWSNVVDVGLTGVWKTTRAAVPAMIEAGSGAIVITTSVAALICPPNSSAYASAKAGALAYMKCLAGELAQYHIRVNAVASTNVPTTMVLNPYMYKIARPDLEAPTLEDARQSFRKMNPMGVEWVELDDVSNAVLWLASDEARYVTGTTIAVDAGSILTSPGPQADAVSEPGPTEAP
jgi:(+)-trans-carveol dehydrogenase